MTTNTNKELSYIHEGGLLPIKSTNTERLKYSCNYLKQKASKTYRFRSFSSKYAQDGSIIELSKGRLDRYLEFEIRKYEHIKPVSG